MVKVMKSIILDVVSFLQFFDKIGEDIFGDINGVFKFAFLKDIPSCCVLLVERT